MSELDIDPGDRCDSCGAPAFAKAFEKPGGRFFLFCGHCFKRHEPALVKAGWVFVDHCDRIAALP